MVAAMSRSRRHTRAIRGWGTVFLLCAVVSASITVSVNTARAAGGAFQQSQRINSLTMQFGTDTFATANAFGSAFSSTAQTQIQNGITSAINTGETSVLFEMLGLTDLSGTSDPALEVGVLSSVPVIDAANPASYDGHSDLDWWYTPNASDIEPDGTPTVQLGASIAAKVLTASGGPMRLSPGGAFGPAPLRMSSVHLEAHVDASSAPLESTNYFAPGHVPSEQIPADLVSFASMSAGKLRGDISSKSLSQIPIPAAFVSGGSFNCSVVYTAANTFLDLLVSGCIVFGSITVVKRTQPDKVDPAAAPAGAGGPYTLVADASHSVTSCKDHNNSVVTLDECLDAAAYSSYFTFTTDRVIVPPPPSVDLTETAVSDPPASKTINTRFSVSDTALSDGSTGTTVTTATRFYLSLDATKDATDKLMGGTRSVSPLAPAGTSSGSTKVKIPTVPTADYFVLACADDTDVVVEGDEANNCVASATTIHVTVPDLVVTALDNPPAAAGAGSSFAVGATTGNIGNGSSRASTTRFYLSLDKRKNAGDILLTGADPVGVLEPGASEFASTTLTIPIGTAAGTYNLLACADDLKAVKESNEKNNCTKSSAKVVVS
jgi:hypothetical protein